MSPRVTCPPPGYGIPKITPPNQIRNARPRMNRPPYYGLPLPSPPRRDPPGTGNTGNTGNSGGMRGSRGSILPGSGPCGRSSESWSTEWGDTRNPLFLGTLLGTLRLCGAPEDTLPWQTPCSGTPGIPDTAGTPHPVPKHPTIPPPGISGPIILAPQSPSSPLSQLLNILASQCSMPWHPSSPAPWRPSPPRTVTLVPQYPSALAAQGLNIPMPLSSGNPVPQCPVTPLSSILAPQSPIPPYPSTLGPQHLNIPSSQSSIPWHPISQHPGSPGYQHHGILRLLTPQHPATPAPQSPSKPLSQCPGTPAGQHPSVPDQ